jgi:transposase-like protein
MIVCPSCKSSKIRNDYKPAPFVFRMIGVRSLLCDHCNHQFRAFCPRSPKSRVPRQSQRKADVFNQAPEIDLTQLNRNQQSKNNSPATPEPAMRIHLKDLTPVAGSQSPVTGEIIAPIRRDLRTEITKLHQQGAKDAPAQLEANSETEKDLSFAMVCPECGSQSVKRRQRNSIERAVFSITDHKAFTCRDCSASFYGKLDENGNGPSVIKSSDAALF